MRLRSLPPQLEFAAGESAVLQSLLDELRPVIEDDTATGADDPVRQRLFPSAYPDDGDAEAEYRSITEATLRIERGERIAACAAELAAGQPIDLADPDVVRRWLQVLNDLRLALGIRLGVTEDPPHFDPSGPDAQLWPIYGWLTDLQELVVDHASR